MLACCDVAPEAMSYIESQSSSATTSTQNQFEIMKKGEKHTHRNKLTEKIPKPIEINARKSIFITHMLLSGCCRVFFLLKKYETIFMIAAYLP